ncbi:MAG: amidase [Geminicoccaceae bacterium]
MSNDIVSRSASELALMIRTRQVSPVEVMDAFIARIEARNPSLNALVFTDFDGARADARKAEQAVMSGAALGPLHGVPTAIKDLFDFKPGWPATLGGIRALRNFRPDWWCLFAKRISDAGAILVGKTNSPIFGFRGVCDNYLFGPGRNPFDTDRNSGGSSGGGAAAVGDGLLPFCEGTDGGGSIRIPASWCGIYGFKASAGRVPVVSRPNAFLAAAPFIHEGPLTRNVEDAALVMSQLAGYDARDPQALPDSVDFMAATGRSIRGWKIAYSHDFGIFPVDRRVRAVVDKAVQAFADAGAIVEDVTIDMKHSQEELGEMWCRLIIPLTVTSLEAFKRFGIDLEKDHPQDLPPEVHEWLDFARRQTASDLYADLEKRTDVYDAVQGVLDRYDLLVTPTLACLPVQNGTDGNTVGPAEIEGRKVNRLIGWCMTYPINYTGHPAATVPAGLADGLPVGMQIIGRRYADGDVIAASAAFERVRPWRDSYRIPEGRRLG